MIRSKGPEALFKEQVIKGLRANGYEVTPIQSRTIPGIPDLFVAGPAGCKWIELKCINKPLQVGHLYHVPFRTGQQAWACRFRWATKFKEEVICLIEFSNCIAWVPIRQPNADRKVSTEELIRCRYTPHAVCDVMRYDTINNRWIDAP